MIHNKRMWVLYQNRPYTSVRIVEVPALYVALFLVVIAEVDLALVLLPEQYFGGRLR